MSLGLYPILDVGPRTPPEAAPALAAAYLQGGARLLQLRAKTLAARPFLELARALVPLVHRAGGRLIINDRPDLAWMAEADGVHLGQDDLPAEAVRPWLPAKMIIGVSCHNEVDLLAVANAGVADYCGYGPIFPTGSKANPDPVVGLPGLAAAVKTFPGLPLVAIGGLTRQNLTEVAATGVSGAALIADLLAGPDPTAACREAVAAFMVKPR